MILRLHLYLWIESRGTFRFTISCRKILLMLPDFTCQSSIRQRIFSVCVWVLNFLGIDFLQRMARYYSCLNFSPQNWFSGGHWRFLLPDSTSIILSVDSCSLLLWPQPLLWYFPLSMVHPMPISLLGSQRHSTYVQILLFSFWFHDLAHRAGFFVFFF